MSASHKAALAAGRNEGRAVAAYLEALELNRPKRGRKRTPPSIEKRLAALAEQYEVASPIKALQLAQERLDLTRELAGLQHAADTSELERQFVKVAKGYAARKGITYAAWREIGVPAEVLKRAGIGRAAS
jgi:hypothetical protein